LPSKLQEEDAIAVTEAFALHKLIAFPRRKCDKSWRIGIMRAVETSGVVAELKKVET
jgi:hypothetical protein